MLLPNLGLILLAGGESLRFQQSQTHEVTSKLLATLGEGPYQTILEHAFTRLTQNTPYQELIIVAHPQWQEAYQTLLSKHPLYQPSKTQWVLGGQTRRNSVLNGLNALSPSIDLALIHDGARPLVEQKDIEKLIQTITAQKSGGASLAHPTINTIKQVEPNKPLKTLPRQTLWEIYTPQAFWKNDLLKAHKLLDVSIEVTDDLQVMEKTDIGPLTLVKSSKNNIKLSSQEELPLLKFLATQTPNIMPSLAK
jgi:2-C-methyl-D-erythritol 4-phosphate cytidylyltransferase